MNNNQISIANKIYEKCAKMITYDESKISLINYDINNLLINCGDEEILGFVYMETKEKKKSMKNYMKLLKIILFLN
jgi:hypothetical protein